MELKEEQAVIIASCTVSRISTNVSGGISLTLSIPESDFLTAAKLLPLYQQSVGVVITPEIL